MLVADSAIPTSYEAYVAPTTATIGTDGTTQVNSSVPNMTFLSSGNDITATVNLDTNIIINKLITDNTALKSAVVALGGTI